MNLRQMGLAGLMAGLFWGQAASAESLPQRWVSAGGSLSEWVVELGGESKLVGVDSTSQHPVSLKALPIVGYQRALSSEGILALRPDILVGTEEMGPPPVVEQLRAAKVHIEILPARAELSAVDEVLQRLGLLLGETEKAAQLQAGFHQRLEALQARVEQEKGQAPGVLMLIGAAGANPMVAGSNTAGDWMIRLAGGRNLAQNEGYKTLSVEALTGLNPDILVIADRSVPVEDAAEALVKRNPPFASLKAVQDKRLIPLDPTLLVGGLGPRLPDALDELNQAFYPATSKTD